MQWMSMCHVSCAWLVAIRLSSFVSMTHSVASDVHCWAEYSVHGREYCPWTRMSGMRKREFVWRRLAGWAIYPARFPIMINWLKLYFSHTISLWWLPLSFVYTLWALACPGIVGLYSTPLSMLRIRNRLGWNDPSTSSEEDPDPPVPLCEFIYLIRRSDRKNEAGSWRKATQFIFLVTKIMVSVFATGDFISLMIQSFAFFVFFGYVPWALVCDFRTAKEVKLEWERIRKIRRGEDMDHVGESHLERKGMKNRWRSDRAWQECLFLTLQGLCWLGELSSLLCIYKSRLKR